MPKRHSRRQSRAQKRHRRSMKGGRREDVPVKEEDKKEETGFLGGLFGSDEKKEDVPKEVPSDAAPPSEAPSDAAPPTEVTDAPATPAPAAPAEGEKKPKGKKKRHGKYYTPKQLKMACRKMSSKKRNRKNKGKFTNFVPTPMPMNAANQNSPYSFGERPVM